jgi:tetratricopeptide (TPR) repeat protein
MTGGPLFVSSGDAIADGRYRSALERVGSGDLVGAAEILARTVELAPAFTTAWFALGAIRDNLGDRAGAIAAWQTARDADPDDYHGARLQLARLGAGNGTPAMTATYVRRLFDQQAASFDETLTEWLDYRGPEILLEAARHRGTEVAHRLHARPRLRHRTRRRGISAARGLARGRRPIAGHDCKGAREGTLRSAGRQ